jgi:hypothetical protein
MTKIKGVRAKDVALLVGLIFSLGVGLILVSKQVLFSPKAATPFQDTETVAFLSGWNFVSFTLDPGMTAMSLCRQFPTSLEVSIYRFEKMYKGTSCALLTAATDFTIQPYTAYWMYVAQPYALTMTGEKVPPVWNLTEGLTAIGIPNASKREMTAEDVCGYQGKDKLTVVRVDVWQNNTWREHKCQAPEINDFVLQPNEGYFVETKDLGKPGQYKRTELSGTPDVSVGK